MDSSKASDQPSWLENSSFSETLISAPPQIPEWYLKELEEYGGLEPPLTGKPTETSNVESSLPSSDDGKDKRKETRKHRQKSEEKHRNNKSKRKDRGGGQTADDKHIGSLNGMPLKRKADVKAWVGGESQRVKEYYFDGRGDRDNLAFGSLYRLDIARYHRHFVKLGVEHDGRLANKEKLSGEEDSSMLDQKIKAEGRYWSTKFASLERRKDLKRLRLPNSQKPRCTFLPAEDYISLEALEPSSNKTEDEQDNKSEESWDDYVLRKTREFNQLTREQPQNESLWIAFAKFQDELVEGASKKAIVQQGIEKKIAILERALAIHINSEDLLLMFLNACRQKDDTQVLFSKWEDIIWRNSGSIRLWCEFLRLCRNEFSLFSVSSLRKLYAHALQALSATRNKLLREVSIYSFLHSILASMEANAILTQLSELCGLNKNETATREIIESENNLVMIFMDLFRFEWQTGHHELALGLFQAEAEYSIFTPSLKLSESSKLRLFQAFWDGNAPRIGEKGATGWDIWLQKEEEQRVNAEARAKEEDEEQEGGWTGWSEPIVTKEGNTSKDEIMEGEEEEEEDGDDLALEDKGINDEAALLERLGLSLESISEVEVKDTHIWNRWSQKECERDRAQWFPIRPKYVKMGDHIEGLPEVEEDEELERAVLFDDVREFLFSIDTEEARYHLIAQFCSFCNRQYPQWCCSNDRAWGQIIESYEAISGLLLMNGTNASVTMRKQAETDGMLDILEKLVGSPDWFKEFEGRAQFLQNVLLQCRGIFSYSLSLQKTLLSIETSDVDGGNSSSLQPASSRALAKKLLKTNRQDLILWGAYACREAALGNLDTARKVFETTLASLCSLPKDVQAYAPVIYLSFADMELSHSESSSSSDMDPARSKLRVFYILSFLGSGIPYHPYQENYTLPGTQILKTKKGFKELLQAVRSHTTRGGLTEVNAALIACAALFEEVSDGWEAAANVFEESFAMSLPGQRQRSYQYELLFLRYVKMLEKYKRLMKPAHVRHINLEGLKQYPSSSALLSVYVRCNSTGGLTNHLRRFFDDINMRNPSTVTWLYAISFELRREGAGHRIHGLFEKALGTRETQQSIVLWRCYLAYELEVVGNPEAARRVFFRAIHACPWSKALWLDGYMKMSHILSAKELSDFQDVMQDKGLRIRTDVYEILLEEEDAVIK